MAARRITLLGGRNGLDSLRNRANDGRLGPLLARNERAREINNEIARTDDLQSEREPPSRSCCRASRAARQDRRMDRRRRARRIELNAADFLIAPSLALIAYRNDLRPQIEARPAGTLLERVLPEPVRERALG